MKSTRKFEERPFNIYIPATEERPAVKVATITVQVWVDEDGDEILAPESLELVEKTQARYIGLLTGSDIRVLRERLKLSQLELSELLGCGEKSLSRWENGRGYPSQLVNTLLRVLDEGLLTLAQLRSLQRPRTDWAEIIFATPSSLAHFRIASTPQDAWDDCPAFGRGKLDMQLFGS
ncbi:type II toxin-antitoxin system MqsA family antitoxin [Verrucomicrobium sp. BvORR034]|uniref:type II toxin-antitoxin system MqsA family antitoxin n=1 Tax=Verrucomicrobium sp. BvORR034 TaxID=1396418 RepID=UPI0006798DAE|nr:type II toxin-antitoxin system MqsA family antitoxin [Verrucomicrobium sp. BvORR034]